MEEMERDFVTFTDDDGNDFELDVIDYFEYEGQEYAVLMDLSEECEHGEDEECDCGHDVYIMKIVVNGDFPARGRRHGGIRSRRRGQVRCAYRDS